MHPSPSSSLPPPPILNVLQSNKAKLVAAAKGLAVVETISSIKLANTLEKALAAVGRETPLPVYVQVNTSGEEAKGGVPPAGCAAIVAHISGQCPHLQFTGLMTIGEYGRVMQPGEVNPDFVALAECRLQVAAAVGMEVAEVELSMGMSGDYEHAIELGSTNVRVGSTIFGARQYANAT
jgi:pyridoxal phosphate enzyme (YggS family)